MPVRIAILSKSLVEMLWTATNPTKSKPNICSQLQKNNDKLQVAAGHPPQREENKFIEKMKEDLLRAVIVEVFFFL